MSSKAFMVGGIPHVDGSYSLASLNGVTYSSIQPTNFLFNLYNLTPDQLSKLSSDKIKPAITF